VDEVADRAAVAGRPVHPGERELLVELDGGEQLAEQVAGAGQLQTGTQLRVCPDRVEVAQRQDPQVVRPRTVGQHLLDHDLGPAAAVAGGWGWGGWRGGPPRTDGSSPAR